MIFKSFSVYVVLFSFLLILFIGPSPLIVLTGLARILSISSFKDAAFNFASRVMVFSILLIFVLHHFFFLLSLDLLIFSVLDLDAYLITSSVTCDFRVTIITLRAALTF